MGKSAQVLVLTLADDFRIEIRAAPQDIRWLRLLFTRNSNPFKALRDMGYVPEEPKHD